MHGLGKSTDWLNDYLAKDRKVLGMLLVIARRVVLPGCSSMAPTAAGEVKMFQRLRTSPVVRADELVIRAAPKSYDSTK
jgi:hypothetical protein